MELRKHPLILYGVPTWPPRWSPVAGPKNEILIGEIGVLKRISHSSTVGYACACHLYIEYSGMEYMGTLLTNDITFSNNLYLVLQHNLNRPIKEIGSIDMP